MEEVMMHRIEAWFFWIVICLVVLIFQASMILGNLSYLARFAEKREKGRKESFWKDYHDTMM